MSENPMNDPIKFSQPTGPRPPDRREVLWNELERLHAQLGIDPPTATYSIEDLAEEIALAQRAYQTLAHHQASALWSKLLQTTPASDPFKVDAAFQRAAQQAGAALEGPFGERILDAQQEAAHRRTHKTWRHYYGPFFFSDPRNVEQFMADAPPPFSPEQPGNADQPPTHESLWTQKRTDSPLMMPRRDDLNVPFPPPSIVQRATQQFATQHGLISTIPPDERAGARPPNEDQAHEADTTDA